MVIIYTIYINGQKLPMRGTNQKAHHYPNLDEISETVATTKEKALGIYL